MRKTLVHCLVAVFLASGSVWAQPRQGLDRVQTVSDPGLRRVSNELSRPISDRRLSIGKVPALVSTRTPQPPQPVTTRSRPSRKAALIGLAAGTAASVLYWSTSRCRYGSDSSAAIVTHCVVPSAAMIAGGWYIGRAIGR